MNGHLRSAASALALQALLFGDPVLFQNRTRRPRLGVTDRKRFPEVLPGPLASHVHTPGCRLKTSLAHRANRVGAESNFAAAPLAQSAKKSLNSFKLH